MRSLLSRIWSDDRGVILATELMFILMLVVIGVITGLVALRQAIISESVEAAQGIMALNQSYAFTGQSFCGASTAGSSASDTTNTVVEASAVASTATINQLPCD